MRRYFDPGENHFLNAEAIITSQPADQLENFVEKLIKFNNKDLNLNVLTAFYYAKTLEFTTLSNWQKMLNDFKGMRGNRMSPEEKGLLNKINSNFLNVNGDIKKIQAGDSNINHFLEKQFPDYDILEYILKKHPTAFFVRREEIFERIRRTFKMVNELDAFDSIKYLLKRKRLSIYFKDEIKKSTQSANYLLKQDAEKLKASMPRKLRFVLVFKEDIFYSYFKEQLHELLPEVEVVESHDNEPDDMLIADSESLQDLASENRVNTKRLYILLKDKAEFASIKDFKPKVFPLPLSLNKVMKAIIPELYTEEQVEEKEE
jgi:hypothetical protein